MAMLLEHFGVRPTTLIPPGDQWTNEVLESALDLGLLLVDSYYLALRDGERFCWCTHVCAPYLDKPDSAWFDSGLPVVGYFHDNDLSLYGIDWMAKWLDRWQEVGAQRFMDFRELAAALGHRLWLGECGSALSLTVERAQGPPLVRPLMLNIRVPDGQIPSKINVVCGATETRVDVEPQGRTAGRIILPVASNRW